MSDLPSSPIIITGMHRSGTSLTASFLAALGIHLGERLLASDPTNPLGYFEDVDFMELQGRMLESATQQGDGGHRNWGWTESESLDRALFPAFAESARALVGERRGRFGLWGWKDPRTTLLLDFWDAILGGRALYVLLYRFPWEVADSIQRVGADVFLDNPEYAFRVWTFYNRALLDFYRRHAERAVLVSANALQRDPALFLDLLRNKLQLALGEAPLEVVWQRDLFVTFDREDPLIRLTAATSPECTQLLAQLDAAADVPAARLWTNSSELRGDLLRPPGPIDVSVVIPCHNHGQFLVDAVASVERTMPSGCELVVVNDGSTEPRTLEVLQVLRQGGYPVVDQANGGLAAARNCGIQAARGRYILPLDADNRLAPRFVETAIHILNTEAETGIVYGDRLEFGVRRGRLKVSEFDLEALLWSNFIDACAVYRRKIWTDCGGYDAGASVWEDWELWIAAANRGWRFRHLPEITFEYRVRPNSMLAVAERKGLLSSVRRYVFRKYKDLYRQNLSDVLVTGHAQFLEASREAIALRNSRDRLQSEIDQLANEQGRSAAPAAIVLLEVFHPFPEGYRQTECQSRYFPKGSWQFLTVDLPARKEKSDYPLRIDPVTYPAIVEIAEICLKRPETGETVWAACAPREFDDFKIAGPAARLPHPKHLRILSFGVDPQIILPASTSKINHEPLRLEVSVFVDPAPEAIKTSLMTLKTHRREALREHEAPSKPEKPLKDAVIPYLSLSAEPEDGSRVGSSLQAPVRWDERQVVRFENIGSLCRAPVCRLRLAPLYAPAVLKISRIVITRDSDGMILYSAQSAEEFNEVEVSEDVVKQVSAENFTVRTNTSGQYFRLPALERPRESSCRLELEIEPYSAPLIRADSPEPRQSTRKEMEVPLEAAEQPSKVRIPEAEQKEPVIASGL